jgi:hypothetical protein
MIMQTLLLLAGWLHGCQLAALQQRQGMPDGRQAMPGEWPMPCN